MIIGTAGHIDHGKTSLVKALTGVDADRLKEEKERGITIDLGFAYWPRPGGGITGFVDVPGHERFLQTMLAGTQALDLVLLVIAADDGIMPQTLEHLEIIELLGIERMLVALTKIDAVPQERRIEAAGEITDWLAGTRLAVTPILPVSSVTGEGLADLTAALDAESERLAARSGERQFRLSVDRCFTLQGAGVVVTGMVLDGEIAVGDEVVVSPAGLSARVRSIHAQNRKAERGRAGERCALNLSGPQIEKDAIRRGEMVLAVGAHDPTQRIDARLTTAPGAAKGLQQWMPARLHHATAEIGARIVLLGEDRPQPGDETLVQLVLDRPIAARARDRFVLRDVSADHTLGGGDFLDLRAPERKRRSPERLAILAALSRTDPVAALRALMTANSGTVDLSQFARDRGADGVTAEGWAKAADAVTFTTGRQQLVLSRARLVDVHTAVQVELANFHKQNPDLAGTGLERLRLQTAARIPAPVFRALLRGLAGEGAIVIEGNWVRLSSHQIALSVQEETIWLQLSHRLAGSERFRPPRVRDIAGEIGKDEAVIRQLFRRIGRAGELHEVSQDHFFPRHTVAEAVEIAAAVETVSSGWFTAALFRDALEAASGATVGRKVAIQILEFFDRHGVTIRRSDLRRLNPHRRDLFAVSADDATTQAENVSGREASLVGRPDFKSGWGCETVSGGFDSHSLPPDIKGLTRAG